MAGVVGDSEQAPKIRMLIVEDRRPLRELLGMLVENLFQMKPLLASGPEQALRCAADEPANLVLLDWQLHGAASGALLAALKERLPQAPVIVMSAGEFQQTALDLGCDDYLLKPFGMHEIRGKLARWLPVTPAA